MPAPLARQIGRFAVTGLANTALGLGVILAAHDVLNLGLIASNLMGYGAGLTLSFTLNRRWTFGHAGHPLRAALLFALVVAAGFGASLGITSALLHLGFSFFPAQLMGVLAYSCLTFVGFRHVAFAV